MEQQALTVEDPNVKIISVNIPPKSGSGGSSNIARNGMKKIGTREEVFQGIAIKTNGGMYRNDIIFDEKLKKGYISKKISTRMKQKRKTIKSNTILAPNPANENLVDVKVKVAVENVGVETITAPSHQAKTMKRVVFKPENNKIFEYECENINSLDDIDVNFSLKPSSEFKIETIPDIDISSLFE
jgi:hypothetical protein